MFGLIDFTLIFLIIVAFTKQTKWVTLYTAIYVGFLALVIGGFINV